MDQQQQYCLKWSNYSSNLAMAFSSLFESESLTDVTLFCGGQTFQAHKIILAACSKNFADLFKKAPANGSVYVILEATSADNMSALLEFMYKGEVHVSQKALESFLKAAESLQVKGLTTEHGRLANTNQNSAPQDGPLESPPTRRNQRNSLSSSLENLARTNIKRENDMIMHSSAAALGYPSYLTPTYLHQPYEPQRKRGLRSPYLEQETRGSVLRDGSKASTRSASPIGIKAYRPASSGSSIAPTEADTLQADRDSPQQSSRFENHSPSTTQNTGNGNGAASNSDKDERNVPDQGKGDMGKLGSNVNFRNGAEDLRVRMEIRSMQSPIASSAPPTPTTPVGFINVSKGCGLPGGLEASIAPADMLNVLSAQRESVNTADGKKLQCPLCDRQYGYETNLRAHIRQRHQGIRVPCPYCSRTFTRNNTVRRHIAREHKQHYIQNQIQS